MASGAGALHHFGLSREGLINRREVDSHGRALARFAPDIQAATALFDNAKDRG